MVTAEQLIKNLEIKPQKVRKTKIEGVPISTLKELKIGDIRRLTKEFRMQNGKKRSA